MEQYRCFGCMQLISEPVCPHCGHPAEGVNFPHQLPVGTVLGGRYFVGRAVNQTENALTYVAYDQNENKSVLISEYYPGMAASREGAQVRPGAAAYEAGLENYRREAQLLAGDEELSRVSGTVDAFETNGTVYIAMDQIRGPGLRQYIALRGGALDPQETMRIFRGIVAAVATLHQSGCAHGGISLDRIVLETDCPYMSPEPFRGKRNDPGKLYRMAEKLAEIRGLSVEEIQRITTENGKRLYRMSCE